MEPIKSTITTVLTVIILSHLVRSGNISASCDHPGEPVNGEAIPDKQEYSTGEKITFKCSQNLVLIGDEEAECLGNNNWSFPVPSCGWNVGLNKQIEYVEEPEKIDLKVFSVVTDNDLETCLSINEELTLIHHFHKKINVTHVDVHIKENSTTSYNITVDILRDPSLRCDTEKPCHREGIDNDSTVKKYRFACGSSDDPQSAGAIQFTFPPTVALELCEIIAVSHSDRECPSPEVCINCKITNATSEFVIYQPKLKECSISQSEQIRYCKDGKWSGKLTRCRIGGENTNSCGKPEIPANGKIEPDNGDKYKDGEKVTIKCNQGYLLDGPRKNTCVKGSWDSSGSYCDKNLLLNQTFEIQTQNITKYLVNFTDGDLSSGSKLVLNNKKTLIINLRRTYDIDMFIFTMNLNDPYKTSDKGNYLRIDIETGNHAAFRFCRSVFYNNDDWINDTIKFTCEENLTTCSTIRLTLIGHSKIPTLVNLREFQIFTTQLHLERQCKVKEHSPNCVAKEMFDSDGIQYLLFSAKPKYLLYGKKRIQCVNGAWSKDPPCCIVKDSSNCTIKEIDSKGNQILHYLPKPGFYIVGRNTSRCVEAHLNKEIPKCFAIQNKTDGSLHLKTLQKNETYQIWAIVTTAICIVLVIGAIILVGTKRISWGNQKNVTRERPDDESSNVNSYEEIHNEIYEASTLERIHTPSAVP